MNKLHVVITKQDEKLVATPLSPSDPVPSGIVLTTYVPLGNEMIGIAFVGMEHQEAVRLGTSDISEVMIAIAESSGNVAQQGERWYALTMKLPAKNRARKGKFVTELGSAIAPVGWLNPIVLQNGDGYLLDIAISDEQQGRDIIGALATRWGAHWSLEVKTGSF
jgi:hypothetical protein